jgi:prepilin-type N-terminal cleavage/methylation domain-containing protein
MCVTKKTANRRQGFTLVELIVVIAIILLIAALAAAFAPRVNDSTNLTRAIDNLEQWLLTAKMRAKRDGVATGVRFIPDPNNPTSAIYYQLQYIQQPDPLSGTPGPNGATLVRTINGIVVFSGVDFTQGNAPSSEWLVQPGDYLEVHGGGVYYIGAVANGFELVLGPGNRPTAYDSSLNITIPTSNFRILRQPRILIGEQPLTLPNNYAVNFNTLPGTSSAGSNVGQAPNGFHEIMFSPTGAVVGANAHNGRLLLSVYDQTMTPFDINRVGIVAVQCRTGFIGAYSAAPGTDPFLFAELGRESGL